MAYNTVISARSVIRDCKPVTIASRDNTAELFSLLTSRCRLEEIGTGSECGKCAEILLDAIRLEDNIKKYTKEEVVKLRTTLCCFWVEYHGGIISKGLEGRGCEVVNIFISIWRESRGCDETQFHSEASSEMVNKTKSENSSFPQQSNGLLLLLYAGVLHSALQLFY